MKDKGYIIAVDFDGTCVTHEYPAIGKDIGAAPILRRLTDCGNKIILWTMRSGRELKAAVEWFEENNIPLWGINKNPDQSWSTSPKAYANIYIDDAAIGTPLKTSELSARPYVDWDALLFLMMKKYSRSICEISE